MKSLINGGKSISVNLLNISKISGILSKIYQLNGVYILLLTLELFMKNLNENNLYKI